MSLSFHSLSGATLACALLFSSTTLWAKDYYKWVDAKGSTHYTTTPPPKSAQKKGKVQTYGWNNSAPSTNRGSNPAVETQANNSTMPVNAAATAKPAANMANDTTKTTTNMTPPPAEGKAIPAPKPDGKNYSPE